MEKGKPTRKRIRSRNDSRACVAFYVEQISGSRAARGASVAVRAGDRRDMSGGVACAVLRAEEGAWVRVGARVEARSGTRRAGGGKEVCLAGVGCHVGYGRQVSTRRHVGLGETRPFLFLFDFFLGGLLTGDGWCGPGPWSECFGLGIWRGRPCGSRFARDAGATKSSSLGTRGRRDERA